MPDAKNIIIAAFAAGVAVGFFMSVASVVPFVKELCMMGCCLYLAAAGFLAAFVIKKLAGKITTQAGAIAGMLTGVVAAVCGTVLTVVFSLVGLNPAGLPGFGFLGLGAFDFGGLSAVVATLIVFMLTLLVDVVFCGIGGVLGAVLLEKK